MAPQKPLSDENAGDMKVIKKKSEDKVVKRPARGYHKFRNGMLNVKPKGNEKDMVNDNQKSPLLQLPPEIRNSIWMYALGNMHFRSQFLSSRRYEIVPMDSAAANAMGLLRTCRQIYSEVALMPLTLSTFVFQNVLSIKPALAGFKPYQQKLIKTFQLEHNNAHSVDLYDHDFFMRFKPCFLYYLPGLEVFRVRISTPPSLRSSRPFEEARDRVGARLTRVLWGRPIVFEVVNGDL